MEFIGQQSLISQVNKYTKDNFPRTSIFVGDKGCGKHTLINALATKFKLMVEDITEKLTSEYITEIYTRSSSMLYLIDLDNLTILQQNIMLKLIEEPLDSMYIMLVTVNPSKLLNTVVNRCIEFKFSSYTKEELKQFDETVDDEVLDICNTPGQILTSKHLNLKALKKFCNFFLTKIHAATYQNTLTIADKINYSDEYDKYDLYFFFKLIMKEATNLYIETKDEKYLTIYLFTKDTFSKMNLDKRLDKPSLVRSYLTSVWKETHTA